MPGSWPCGCVKLQPNSTDIASCKEQTMASWIIPALKAVLPHVGTIITAAKPIFTKSRPDSLGLSADAPVQQQIAELQAAAAQNDATIRKLAEQLQRAVTALED